MGFIGAYWNPSIWKKAYQLYPERLHIGKTEILFYVSLGINWFWKSIKKDYTTAPRRGTGSWTFNESVFHLGEIFLLQPDHYGSGFTMCVVSDDFTHYWWSPIGVISSIGINFKKYKYISYKCFTKENKFYNSIVFQLY